MGSEVESIAVPRGGSISAHGRMRLTSVTIREPETAGTGRSPRSQKHDVDALLVEARGAPSFELAEQAGAAVAFDATRGGYLPVTDARGRARQGLWCTGELAGTGSDLALILAHADEVARDVVEDWTRAALPVSPR